jgi:hypothetical protein
MHVFGVNREANVGVEVGFKVASETV